MVCNGRYIAVLTSASGRLRQSWLPTITDGCPRSQGCGLSRMLVNRTVSIYVISAHWRRIRHPGVQRHRLPVSGGKIATGWRIFRHVPEVPRSKLCAALADTPVVLLKGARQTGKTTLVKHKSQLGGRRLT